MTNNQTKTAAILAASENHASVSRMDIGFLIRLSALALSENGDAKYWYRGY